MLNRMPTLSQVVEGRLTVDKEEEANFVHLNN